MSVKLPTIEQFDAALRAIEDIAQCVDAIRDHLHAHHGEVVGSRPRGPRVRFDPKADMYHEVPRP